MTATGRISGEDALEAADLLCFVAALCHEEPAMMSAVLSRFVGVGYGAEDLGADSARLSAELARSVGLADTLMEPAP